MEALAVVLVTASEKGEKGSVYVALRVEVDGLETAFEKEDRRRAVA